MRKEGWYQRVQDLRISRLFRNYWIPLLLGVVATIAVLGLWQQLLIQEHLHFEQLIQQEVRIVQAEFKQELIHRVTTLQRMANRWQKTGGTTQEIWEADAAALVQDFDYQGIEWVDSSFQVRWVVPLANNHQVLNLDWNQEPVRRSLLQQAQTNRHPVLSKPISLIQGGQGVLVVIPLSVGDRFDGCIIGILTIPQLFDNIFQVLEGYQVRVYADQYLVYNPVPHFHAHFKKRVKVSTYGVNWKLEILPQPETLIEERSHLHEIILIGGLVGSWTLAFTVGLGQRSERYAQRVRAINQQLQAEIRQRQQAEAHFQKSEERWQLALRGNNDGIWDWDLKTDEVFFSSRWKTMIGYEDGEISNHIEEWSKRVHPDDLVGVKQTIQDHLAKKTPFYISEHRVQCKDASYKWILDRGQALWDETGQAIRMIGSHTDITERKQAEVALQESEARYRELVNNVNMGFVVHAPDTTILFCNSTACQLLGLSMEQMLGKTAIDPTWHFVREDGSIMPTDEYPVNQVRSTGIPLTNYVLGINTGTTIKNWVLVTAFPEFDVNHQLRQIAVSFIDINSLKQATADLQEMSKVLENAVSAISKIDPQGRYLYVNKTYASITGYQPEEMIGMSWEKTVHPDELEKMMAVYEQMLQAGRVEVETTGVRKDGSIFYKQLVMIPTYDEQHQLVNHYCFMKDISDRKRAELALEQELLRSKTLFNTSMDGVVIMDQHGDVVQTSPSFARMIGYTVEETLKLNVADWEALWTREDLKQIREQDHYLSLFETKHRRKDGSLYDAEISYSRVILDGQMMHFSICRDISDRKRIEAERQQAATALRQSEARFQAFMNHSPTPAWITDDQGIIVYLSQTYVNVFQVPSGDLIGKSIFEVYPPDIAQQFLNNIQTVARTASVVETIEIAPRRDGCIGDFLVYKFPIPDASRQILVGCVAIDITLQHRAEEALRQSEATKQAIIEAIPDLLIRMRANGDYLDFVSNSKFNIVNPERIRQNVNLFEILPHDLAQIRMHYTKQALQTRTTQVYEHQIVIEEQLCYEEVRIVPLPQDEVLVMVRDITDRKRAEIELKHQKELLQAMFDYIPIMVALFDQKGRIEFINPELQRVLGWSIQDWEQQNILTDCYPNSIYCQEVIDHMLAATGQWKDFTTLTASGQTLYTSWANVRLSNGYYLGIGQDITTRKQFELQLQQAKEAAEVANQAKSIFLANMSHELRTPLNVILGFAQVMGQDLNLSSEQQENLQIIRRSGDHLLNLINDVLDLSKIEAGHSKIDLGNVDLVALLHSLRSMFSQRAIAKDLAFNVEIAPDLPQYIITDPSKLRQILINLLSNAIKFTKQGWISLRVKVLSNWQLADAQSTALEPGQGVGKSTAIRDTLLFEVEDTGNGIAQKDLKTIFDAFVQAESRPGTAEGTGLGLTISRKLARLLNGEITVQSWVGQGSIFQLRLPVQQTQSTTVQAESIVRHVIGLAPNQPHYRILVVDDQLENRLLLVKLLTQLGFQVREAANGQEAIAVWQEWHPHLIWMDIRMPVLNGYEATKQIREQEHLSQHRIFRDNSKASKFKLDQEEQGSHAPPTLIIALTAHASQSDRDLALAAGCDDYMSKPFQQQMLLDKMAQYLGVSYLYAEVNPPSASATPVSLSRSLTSESLSVLPSDWLVQFKQVARSCNQDAVLSLIEQIPDTHHALIAGLRQLAQNFDFRRIVQLIDSSQNLES